MRGGRQGARPQNCTKTTGVAVNSSVQDKSKEVDDELFVKS